MPMRGYEHPGWVTDGPPLDRAVAPPQATIEERITLRFTVTSDLQIRRVA
jgi:hypothetical protein